MINEAMVVKGSIFDRKKEYIFLFLILLLGLLLRIYYFEGIDFDGTMFTLQAKNILDGIYDPKELYALPFGQGVRLAIILPITLSFMLFGISEWSAILPVFLSSIIGIVVIYYFGKLLFNEKVGLVAAFLLAIFPLDVNYTTILEADIMLGLFTTVVVLLYYKGVEEDKKIYLFIAGVVLGIAVFIKIVGLLLISFFILYELLFTKKVNKSFKNLLLFSLGLIFGSLPFLLYFFSTTGNPFYFYLVETHANQILASSNVFDLSYYPFLIFLIKFHNEMPMLNIYFILCFFIICFYIKKRTKETNMLILLFLVIFLLLEFVPSLPKTQRYLLMIETPLILLIAKGIYDFSISCVYTKLKIVILIVLFLSFFSIGYSQYGKYYLFSDEFYFEGERINHEEYMIYLALKDLPERNIYVTNYNMVPLLSFYFQYTQNSSTLYGYKGLTNTSIYDLHYVIAITDIHDSYVILDRRVTNNDIDPFNYYNKTNVSGLGWFSGNMSVPSNWNGYMLFPIGTGDTKDVIALFYVK